MFETYSTLLRPFYIIGSTTSKIQAYKIVEGDIQWNEHRHKWHKLTRLVNLKNILIILKLNFN